MISNLLVQYDQEYCNKWWINNWSWVNLAENVEWFWHYLLIWLSIWHWQIAPISVELSMSGWQQVKRSWSRLWMVLRDATHHQSHCLTNLQLHNTCTTKTHKDAVYKTDVSQDSSRKLLCRLFLYDAGYIEYFQFVDKTIFVKANLCSVPMENTTIRCTLPALCKNTNTEPLLWYPRGWQDKERGHDICLLSD